MLVGELMRQGLLVGVSELKLAFRKGKLERLIQLVHLRLVERHFE